jgi:uncharacterized membrane protein
MLYSILSISDAPGILYVITAILVLVIWYYFIRASVRADSLVKNQQLILHTLVQIYKKNGATEEEMKQLEEHFNK